MNICSGTTYGVADDLTISALKNAQVIQTNTNIATPSQTTSIPVQTPVVVPSITF